MLKPSCIALAAVLTSSSAAALGQTPTSYTASWTSVDQHPAAPEWFKDAKFGIYFHWGTFGTAQYGSEWYPSWRSSRPRSSRSVESAALYEGSRSCVKGIY